MSSFSNVESLRDSQKLIAGAAPRAGYFSLLRQRKVTKRKPTRIRCRCLRSGALCFSPQPGRSRRAIHRPTGTLRASCAQPCGPFPSAAAMLGSEYGTRRVGAFTEMEINNDTSSLVLVFRNPVGGAEHRRVRRIRPRSGRSQDGELSQSAHGCAVCETPANPRRAGHRAQRDSAIGSPFFWVLFFGEAKKSTSTSKGETKDKLHHWREA